FGAGEAGCFPNLTKAFSSWFQGGDRTRVQSLMWVAARWSGAFTPLVVVAVLEVANWRQSFLLFGSVGFVWAFLFWRWFQDQPANGSAGPWPQPALPMPGSGERPSSASQAGVPWGRFLRSRSVWLLCLQYA